MFVFSFGGIELLEYSDKLGRLVFFYFLGSSPL